MSLLNKRDNKQPTFSRLTHFGWAIVRRNQQNLFAAETKRVAPVDDGAVGRWWENDKDFTHFSIVTERFRKLKEEKISGFF